MMENNAVPDSVDAAMLRALEALGSAVDGLQRPMADLSDGISVVQPVTDGPTQTTPAGNNPAPDRVDSPPPLPVPSPADRDTTLPVPTSADVGRRASESLSGVEASIQPAGSALARAAQPQNDGAPPKGELIPYDSRAVDQSGRSRDGVREFFAGLLDMMTRNAAGSVPPVSGGGSGGGVPPNTVGGGGLSDDDRDRWRQIGEVIAEAVRNVLERSLAGISRGGETGGAGQGRPASPGAKAEDPNAITPPSQYLQIFNAMSPQSGARYHKLRQSLRLPMNLMKQSGYVRKVARGFRRYGKVGRGASRSVLWLGRMTGTLGGVAARAAGGAALGSGASATGAAGAGVAAGGALAGAAGAVAAPFAVIAAAGVALKGFHDAVDGATDSMMNYNRTLGQFSGLMSMVMQVSESQDRFRQREKGDRLAQSAMYLADSENYRKNNTKDMEIVLGRIENYLYGGLNDALGALLKPLNDIAKEILKRLGIEEPVIVPVGESLAKAAKEIEAREVARLQNRP